MKNRTAGAVALTAYVAAIVAANIITSHYGMADVGFGLMVTAGTFAAGFALLARDFVHEYAGVRWVLLGITAGGVLSWVTTDNTRLALASTVAFVGAELLDLGIFAKVRDRLGLYGGAIVSNIISAPVDTVLFLWIAAFPVTWASITGQFVGKVVWATLVPLALLELVRAVVRGRRGTTASGHDRMSAGLEHRYDVKKVNDPTGKHEDCRYFVLDPRHDPIANHALRLYAFQARHAGYVELANDLDSLLAEIGSPDEVLRQPVNAERA